MNRQYLVGVVCCVAGLLFAAAAQAERPATLRGALADQKANVRHMERLLNKTPLRGWLKTAPRRILRSAQREAARFGDRVGFRKEPSFSQSSEVLFGDGRTQTVSSNSGFETKPSYGMTNAWQSVRVTDHGKKAPGLFGGSVNTVRGEQIEIQGGRSGWEDGIKTIKHTRARLHKRTRGILFWKRALNRQLHTLVVPINDGRWLMKRDFQANHIYPKTGEVKEIGAVKSRYYLIGADASRQPLGKRQYHDIYGAEVLGFTKK